MTKRKSRGAASTHRELHALLRRDTALPVLILILVTHGYCCWDATHPYGVRAGAWDRGAFLPVGDTFEGLRGVGAGEEG